MVSEVQVGIGECNGQNYITLGVRGVWKLYAVSSPPLNSEIDNVIRRVAGKSWINTEAIEQIRNIGNNVDYEK